MVDAAPFRALRYDPAVAGDPATTSAPPYEELERFSYASHRTASPYTVLELIAGGEHAYAAAGETYRRWVRTGVLVPDVSAAFYRYEEHELRGGVPAVQRGLLAAVRLEPLGADAAVVGHEAVDAQRVAARRARLEAVPADVAPVFAIAAQLPAGVRELLAAAPTSPPLVTMSDEAGVDHRIWALRDPGEIDTIRAELTDVRLILADGHHRYAAAVALRGRGGAWARTLVYLCDAATDGPRLAPVHRMIDEAPGDLLERLGRDFVIESLDIDPRALPQRLATAGLAFGLVLADGVYSLRARDPEGLARHLPAGASARWRALDSALLTHAVLPSLAQSPGITYRTDLAAAAGEVAANRRAALFVVRPLGIDRVIALALAGERMPPKSTSFRPKPRTGLLLRPLDDGR